MFFTPYPALPQGRPAFFEIIAYPDDVAAAFEKLLTGRPAEVDGPGDSSRFPYLSLDINLSPEVSFVKNSPV